MSELAAKRSFGTHKLVGAGAGMAVVAGRASGVGVGDVITHADDQATAGPDGRYGVTLINNPGDRVRVNYLPDRTAARTMLIPAQQP